MHKTFISFYHEGEGHLKDEVVRQGHEGEFIDKSVGDGDIDPFLEEDTIMRKIREEYLYDSTVTLVIVGWKTAFRPYINSEIQASLRDTSNNRHNGLFAAIRDDLYERMYSRSTCKCGTPVGVVDEALWTKYVPDLIRKNHEFDGSGCHFNQNDVYCGVFKYSNFIKDPSKYVDAAFEKRQDPRFEIRKLLDQSTPRIGR